MLRPSSVLRPEVICTKYLPSYGITLNQYHLKWLGIMTRGWFDFVRAAEESLGIEATIAT